MKNNLIIAGVPRAGKSTLSHAISQKYGYQHVSIDAIVAGFEKVFPELGIPWWPSKAADMPPLDILRNVSGKVALFIKAMLDSGEYDEFEPGAVFDVYQLFPEDYMKCINDENCDIIYLVTSDITPEERFSIHKTYDTEKDYTFYMPDDELRKGCIEHIEQSKFIKAQCMKYGLPYQETARNRVNVFEDLIHSYSTEPLK